MAKRLSDVDVERIAAAVHRRRPPRAITITVNEAPSMSEAVIAEVAAGAFDGWVRRQRLARGAA